MAMLSKTSRRRIFASAMLLLLSTGISTLRAAPPEVLKEVPADAYALIVINNARAFANKISNAGTRLGLPVPPDLIGTATRQIGIKDGFDPNSSIAFVMLKPSDEQIQQGIFTSQPPAVALLPTTDAKAMLEPFKPATPDKDGISEISLPTDPDQKGYAAVVEGKWIALAEKKEDLAQYVARKASFASTASPETLKTFEANDLVTWGNVEKLAAGTDKQLDDLQTTVTGMFDLANVTARQDPLQTALQKQFIISVFSFAKEYVTDGKAAMLTVRLTDSGATFGMVGDFKDKSPLGNFVASQAPVAASGLGASLKGLPSGNFIAAGAAAINSASLVSAINDFEDKLMADPAVVKNEHAAQIHSFVDLAKQEIAITQGFHMVFLDPAAGGQNGLINGALIYDTSDPQKFMDLQTQLLKSASVMQDANPMMTQTITASPDALTVKGVHLTRINVKIALKPDSPDNPVPPEIKAAFPMIQKLYGPDGMTAYYGIVGKRIIFIYGSDNVTIDSSITAAQGDTDTLAANPQIAATKDQVVANPIAVAYLPIARWITLAQSIVAPGGAAPAPGPNITSAPPIVVSAGVSGTTMSFEMHIPLATITGIREAAEAMDRAMMGGGGPPPAPLMP